MDFIYGVGLYIVRDALRIQINEQCKVLSVHQNKLLLMLVFCSFTQMPLTVIPRKSGELSMGEVFIA